MANCSWKAKVEELAEGGHVTEAISTAIKEAALGDADDVAVFLTELGIKTSRSLGLHEVALSLFEAASEIAVNQKQKKYANYNLGVCLTVIGDTFGQQGQLEKAEENLEKAIRYYPEFVLAHKSYGRALFFRGKKKKAEVHLKQAISLDSGDAETHALYGLLLESMKRNRKASEQLREAVRLDPKNGRFHAYLGINYLNQGFHEDAEAEFKTAIEIAPSDIIGLYHYGILLMRDHRWEEAEDYLEKVLRADKTFQNTKALYSTAILKNQSTRVKEPLTEKWKWARKVYFEIERPLDVQDFKLIINHNKKWKNIQDNFDCERCGKCCKNTLWAGHIETRLVWEDIQRWKRQNRRDILQYVLPFERMGGDLIDLKNNKFLQKCPFMQKEKGKYTCTIQETKPFVCRITPFYFHHQETCENCKQPISPQDTYCNSCGIFLKADPNMLLNGCPALRKALKKTGLYKPYRKYDLLALIKANRQKMQA